MARLCRTLLFLALSVCLPPARGHPQPRSAFMQLSTQTGTAERVTRMSLTEAMAREGVASGGGDQAEALERAGLTLETGAKKDTCIVLFCMLAFSCCCFGGHGENEDERQTSHVAGTVIPIGVLLYICFATDILQTGLAGEKLNISCALLCVWSIAQLACGFCVLFGFIVPFELSETHNANHNVPKTDVEAAPSAALAPVSAPESAAAEAPVALPQKPQTSPPPTSSGSSDFQVTASPMPSSDALPTAATSPSVAQAVPTTEQKLEATPVTAPAGDASMTEDQDAMLTNVMQRTGATQEQAAKALRKAGWHGSKAVKALQARKA